MNFESGCESFEGRHRNVLSTAFDATHVGAIDFSGQCQPLLR